MIFRRLQAHASFLLLALSLPATAQTAKRGMTVDDLARLVRIGAPQVSPDGKWIAYTLSHTDTAEDKSVTDLWMISWDGSEDVQLTFGLATAEGSSVGSPRWSPDGRFLSFTSDRPGPAKGSQVWVLDRRGGEAHQLTDVKENLSAYRWSPDGKQLLLTLRAKEEPEPEKGAKPKPPKPIVIDRYHFKQDIEGYLSDKREHLFLYDIATKKLTKLTNDEHFEEREAEWSPDGKLIAFVSNHDAPDSDRTANDDVFVVDAQPASAPRKLTTFEGRDSGPLVWSPDSQQIAYRQGLAKHYTAYAATRLAVVPAQGGPTQLKAASVDNNVGPANFTADGQSLLTTVSDDEVEYVAQVPLSGAAVKRITEEQGVASSLATASGHTALLWSTDSSSPELYALDAGKLRKLTSHNDALLSQLQLAPSEKIAGKSKDGTDVHGPSLHSRRPHRTRRSPLQPRPPTLRRPRLRRAQRELPRQHGTRSRL